MQIKDKSRARIDLCRTPALTLVQGKFCLLIAILFFLLLKKKNHINVQEITRNTIFFNLKISPSCQPLLKALDISKTTPLTSNPSSNDL